MLYQEQRLKLPILMEEQAVMEAINDHPENPHIFVVDDEAPAREMVADYLRMHGFEVTTCDGGASLRQAITQQAPDLIVLDLNMPAEDGLSIIRKLKQEIAVPIIMLTATAGAIDRIVGLELGADDYLAKPCELRELLARIRSVLRRARPVAAVPARPPPTSPAVRFGTKWLDLHAQALRDEGGNGRPLTSSEFGLLKAFAANPKRVLSRERLLELANARDAEAFDRAIDIRIMRLRRKIARSRPSHGDPHDSRRRVSVYADRRGEQRDVAPQPRSAVGHQAAKISMLCLSGASGGTSGRSKAEWGVHARP